MLPDYQDITDLCGTPIWWDQNGVPRYAEFSPDMLGVYDNFALLVRIECQSCRKRLLVGCGWPRWGTKFVSFEKNDARWEIEIYSLESLAEGFKYGDPPRHNCVGDTMSSVAVEIEQAWHREKLEWVRDHEVEKIDVKPDWDN